MRLGRMTLRRLMVVVVITGLTMGAAVGVWRLKRRHDDFQFRARYHGDMEFVCRFLDPITRDLFKVHDNIAKSLSLQIEGLRQTGGERSVSELKRLGPLIEANRQELARLPRGHAYHAAMRQKYEYAARYPWQAVDPDPPLPPRP
jgi:hypothetical protein